MVGRLPEYAAERGSPGSAVAVLLAPESFCGFCCALMFDFAVAGGVLVISAQDTGQEERFVVRGEDDAAGRTHGVYGIVEHGDARCLAIVCDARPAGTVNGHAVLESTRVRVFALGPRCEVLCRRLREFFALPGLFFSRYDLHRRMEDRPVSDGGGCAQDEFLFNSYPLRVYRRDHRHFTLNCIQGYFGSYRGLALISRRSPQRAGARFFSRGCDASGNCSNFVETEQVWRGKSTYIQLRGSIPLFWGHLVGWRYNPPVVFGRGAGKEGGAASAGGSRPGTASAEGALSGFERAHSLLLGRYREEIIYLNLVRENGYEGTLCSMFNRVLDGHRGFHYDFHGSIGKKEFPFVFRDTGFTGAGRRQKAVIRTNCIDCLDRTNSMQFMIGREVLEDQIREDTCAAGTDAEDYLRVFGTLYHENGNYLSLQYAGTPALLSQHILGRTGRRHRLLFLLFGLHLLPACLSLARVQDGLFSVRRYLINRLCHGRLQNAYEIVTGLRSRGALVDTRRRTAAAFWGFCFCTLASQWWEVDSVSDAVLVSALLCAFLYGFMASILDVPVA